MGCKFEKELSKKWFVEKYWQGSKFFNSYNQCHPLLGIIAETLSSTEIEKMFPADEIRLKKVPKGWWQLSGKDGQGNLNNIDFWFVLFMVAWWCLKCQKVSTP